MQDERFRNFTCIVYPESAPEDFIERIDNLHVPAFLSPLHDKDTDGQKLKKPHYHVILMYEGKKNVEQVRKICLDFGGVVMEVVQSIRGAARYLCHLDNPEKHRYSTCDVRCFAGADYDDICTSQADYLQALDYVFRYIDSHKIKYYHQLLNSLFGDQETFLLKICCFSCIGVVKEYLRSKQIKER